MTSFSALCQIDTTKMTFPTNTIRLLYKDALKGDKYEQEKTYLYSQIDLYKQKNKEKDSLIIGYKKLDKNNQAIIKKDSIQKELYKANALTQEKSLSQEKNKKRFWITTTIVATITTLVAIFK